MIKKTIVLLVLAAVAMTPLFAGGSQAQPTFELALVTDHGPVDDRSFNQGAWEGVVQYAEEHGITHRFYRPAENSGSARLEAIRLAAEAGARVIVTPGFAFSEPVFIAQDEFPEIRFVLLDANPARDGTTRIGDNTLSIFYAEEQAGFIVGYAAVREGFRNLGFFGGVSVPAVVRFGVGYILGAEYAAREENVDVTMMYRYLGTFDARPENKTLASTWYNGGTEVIFVAAGGAINNAISAAEELSGKWVIGANVNQQDLSPVILTSSLKQLRVSVYQAISDFYAGTFRGGEAINLTAAEEGVGIPDDFSRFQRFTRAHYDALLQRLISGEITIPSSHTLSIPGDLGLQRTRVTVVN